MRESSGVAPGLASLPSGGGGISPLGERFQPDLVKGSGSYAVPINLPKGPNELRPSLSLTYSTGSGNGAFGLGWRLTSMRIERRTDRGVPTYTDEDTFVIGDAEVLVPVGGNRYRPKTDTQHWFIERMTDGWRVRTGDGRTRLFGLSDATREHNGGQVFAWHLDEEQDAAGNAITYAYRRDGGRLFLEAIRYSIFSVQVQYEARPDVLRTGVAGFERRTALRAMSLELHCDRLTPTLMRSYALAYTQAPNGASLLQRVTLSATDGTRTAGYPPLEFDYSRADFTAWRVHEIVSAVAPPALGHAGTQLVDMTGDGLPDVLQTSGSRMYLWRNAGAGRLEGPTAITGMPSTIAFDRGNVALADLDGNGRVDLFAVDQPLQIVFETDGRGGFEPEPVVLSARPGVRLASADTRLMDIDNDGVTDVISTGRTSILMYRHSRGTGFEEPIAIQRVGDPDEFPDGRFGERGVRLADMTGDGLQDFVVVESGNAAYWPYLGNGRWGARVEMDRPPRFPDGSRDDRIFLADIDGDGCADVVYADYDRTLLWINQSGNGFSAPIEIPVSIGVAGTRILPCDFFGDGRLCFAWSAPGATYRVLRFDGGRKPYVMTQIDNGMGGQFLIEYSTSTVMRLRDREEGIDWKGQLPFVVHVVNNIVERDTITGRETRLTMHYHDGVYDGPQREFRGFTRVSVDNHGDDSVPTSRQLLTFFQGDPEAPDLVDRDRERALAGSLQQTQTFELVGSDYVPLTQSTQTWNARLEFSSAAGTVHFPFVSAIDTRELGTNGEPDRIERTRLFDYDPKGNAARRLRESFADGAQPSDAIRSEERYAYVDDETNWLIKLPSRLELRDGSGVPLAVRISTYDIRGLLQTSQELKLLESRLPAGYVGARDFDAMGYTLTGVGDTRGYYGTTVSYDRDSRGNIVEQRDAMGAATTFVYDADGVYPISATDPRGVTTQFQFAPRSGEPAEIAFADGGRLRYEYDPIGRLVATFSTDDAGIEQLTKVWIADVAAAPTSVTSIAPVAGGRTVAEFGPGTDLSALSGASVSCVYYDAFANELLQVSSAPEQAATPRFVTGKRAVLNPRGLVRAHFPEQFVPTLAFLPAPDPAGASTLTRYDAQGNVAETRGPGPERFRVVRNSFSITHFEGGSGTPSRTERFDARGRLQRLEEAVGPGTVVTSYDLTPDGRIEVVRDDSGVESTRYTFAGASEAIAITHRDVGSRHYYRDAAGRVRERVDPDGSRLFYSYDSVGRLTRVEAGSTGGARRILREVFYDADPFEPSSGRFLDGRIAVVRENGTEIRFSYNRAGKHVREEVTAAGVTLVTRREFDLQGRITAVVYPDGRRVTYELGVGGAVKAITGITADVRYAADGNLESYTLVNGVQVAMTRDAVSRRLDEVSAAAGGAILRRLRYGYDPTGNITSIGDEMAGGQTEHATYDYDGLHRLTSFEIRQNTATGTVLKSGAYDYDAAGNLLRFEEGQPLALQYADAARPGRLTGVTAGAVTIPVVYDARSHTRAFGDLSTIEFDAMDRLSRAVKTDGTELRFSYDPQGRRVLKEILAGGVTRRVHYATGLFERHGTHTLRHIYLGTMMVATEKVQGGAASAAYYLADHHGTILMSTDDAGAVIHQQRYTAFGSVRIPAAALDRYLGRELDVETGLLHLGARYYAPALGRFISPDWWVLENPRKPGRMPQGFNLYSYALNNPLVFKDPSGLWFGIDDLIVAAVGFAVGFVSGLVYGLVNGQGWGSFLTALETGLTTAAGAWLGWTVAGPFGAVMGGMNGLIGGIHGVYDWGSASGWFAFLSDSTWGLIGTTLGNAVHVVNFFWGDSKYRDDLSRRQNRHVYEGGMYLKEGFAFTQGNVISNAGQNGQGINASFIANHEELHVWQSRFFGPIFQATYIVWGLGGLIVGTVVWLTDTDESWSSLVETAAYYDNPFEYWAYKNDNNWPPSGAHPDLRW